MDQLFKFKDRVDAGKQLAQKLKHYKNTNTLILAIPRGGVPVAYEVSNILKLPLSPILVKKIGHPTNKEYAIGAASLDYYFTLPNENLPDTYIQEELIKVRNRLKQMKDLYIGNTKTPSIKDKNVIIIDDGIATGNTFLATIEIIKKCHPKKIIIAVPVASDSAAEKLSTQVDEFISLYIPSYFSGVGAFYESFEQVQDQEVIHLLN